MVQDLIINLGRNHSVNEVFLFPINMLKPIVPLEYFRTTGDLIPKIDVLISDLESEIYKLKQIKKEALKIKGDNKWLETSIDEDSNITFQQKNPRNSK